MPDDSSSESGSNNTRKNNRRFKDKIYRQWAIFCGDCGPARNYIAGKSYNSSWAIIKFLDALFRGYGQVVFANNPISGILVFIGLTVANPVVSAAGLLTACIGLLVSIVMIRQPQEVIINGLTVFNPLLIGLVSGSLLPSEYGIELEYWHFFFMVVAAVICVYVTAAIGNILSSISRYPLPYLTLPFNVVQQLLFLILLSVGPAKIDVSTTSVEPHLLNHTLAHEAHQSLPLVPESLGRYERSVEMEDITYSPETYLRNPAPADEDNDDDKNDNTIYNNNNNNNIQNETETEKPPNGLDEILRAFFKKINVTQYSREEEDDDKDNDHKNNSNNITQDEKVTEEPGVVEKNNHGDVHSGEHSREDDDDDDKNNEKDNTSKSNNDNSSSQEEIETEKPRYTLKPLYRTIGDKHRDRDVGLKFAERFREDDDSNNKNSNNTQNEIETERPRYTLQQIMRTVGSKYRDLDEHAGEHSREVRSVGSAERFYNSSDERNLELDWGGVFSGIVLSMSQAYTFNYAPTSILIYLAVLIYSPITAGFGLVGATLSTVAGVYLSDPETFDVAGGLYDGGWGFNGVLAGMCLGGLFFIVTWSSAFIAVICVIFAAVLQHVFTPSFTRVGLLPLTLPFNLSAMLFLCVTASAGLLRPEVISFPEKQRREYKQLYAPGEYKDHISSANDMDKDSELEKKLAQADVV